MDTPAKNLVAAPIVPEQFPVEGIYEPSPAVAVKSTVAPFLVQVWRYTNNVGHEALVHFAAATQSTTPTDNFGPIPTWIVRAFSIPGTTRKGTATTLSKEEIGAGAGVLTSASGLSQIAGSSIPVIATPLGVPFVLIRDLYVPKERMLLITLSASGGPTGLSLWGYIQGHSWLQGSLNKSQQLQLTYKVQSAGG